MSDFDKFGRMRGLYRGIKRKEDWALRVEFKRKNHPMVFALSMMYRGVEFTRLFKELVYGNNPFLSCVPKDSEEFSGKYHPVPIDYQFANIYIYISFKKEKDDE